MKVIEAREIITGIYANKDLTVPKRLELLKSIKSTLDLCIKDLMLEKVCRDVGLQKGIYAPGDEKYTHNRLEK